MYRDLQLVDSDTEEHVRPVSGTDTSSILRVLAQLLIVFASLIGIAQSTPDYTWQGTRLARKSGVGYEISVATSLKYVGAKRFHIRQAADAEQHIFASADSTGKVHRLVWVQFEQQLPGQNWRYDYPSPKRIRLGELQFITDSGAFRSYAGQSPSADHKRVDELLDEHKLHFDGPVIAIRMVHLPDKERRRELMIIYVESLPPSEEPKFRQLEEDAAQWPHELEKLKTDAILDVRVRRNRRTR